MADSSPWYVYILKCGDGTLYTGVTTDPARRLKEHNQGSRGARFTRARRPVSLTYQERCADRSAACRREWEIKQLSRREKQRLISSLGTESG